MPHEVIMPALGMAQDTGLIVAWHKKPGDAVSEGDVLFEVETDKATMEVEAAAGGFLNGVRFAEGAEVPVGDVIAVIGETPEDAVTASPPEAPSAEALPDGHPVIMPVLGMAQDSGLIVAWRVAPGDKVEEGTVLFEVETDKSTMEVEADRAGFVAALLAEAGEEVPTGQTIALLTDAPPAAPIRRSAGAGAAVQEPAPSATPAPAPAAAPRSPERPAVSAPPGPSRAPGGRILASPKARRLAFEAGIDLGQVVASGVAEPVRAADIAAYRARAGAGGRTRVLTAEVPAATFGAFADWAAAEAGLSDPDAILAGFAAPGLGRDTAVVAVERASGTTLYRVNGSALSAVAPAGEHAPADLVLRDLRALRIASAAGGAGACPVIALGAAGDRLVLTLDCAESGMSGPDSLRLLSELAGRLEEPLRHLL